MQDRIGTSFKNAETVDHYLFRPPYPARLYELLVEKAPSRQRLLDLGCGHGKISRLLVDDFSEIVAVDPSAKMIELGRTLPQGTASNLNWAEGLAETALLSGTFDLITAALSIHWMDHEALFGRLAKHVSAKHLIAVIDGDDAHEPPWRADYVEFLKKWVPEMTGKPFSEGRYEFYTRYQRHVDIVEEFEIISPTFSQTVEEFIRCQFSRDTFAPSKLGGRRNRFTDELTEILQPHANTKSELLFKTKTNLTFSKLKT